MRLRKMLLVLVCGVLVVTAGGDTNYQVSGPLGGLDCRLPRPTSSHIGLPPPRDEQALVRYLAELDQRIETVQMASADAEYLRYLGCSVRSTEHAVASLWASTVAEERHADVIKEWLPRAQDPLVQRWLGLLAREFEMFQIGLDARIHWAFARRDARRLQGDLRAAYLRAKVLVDGRRMGPAELDWLLQNEPDRARRKALWLAKRGLAEQMAPILVRLFQLRNHIARLLGYRDFFAYQLHRKDLDEAWLLSLLDQTERGTRDLQFAFSDALRSAGLLDAYPWDILYVDRRVLLPPAGRFPEAQAAERLHAFVRSLGFNPTRALPITINAVPTESGGYELPVGPSRQAHVLVGSVQGYRAEHGYLFYHILFHEFGHALYQVHQSRALPFTLRTGAPPAFNEGMAELLEGFVDLPEWQRRYTAMPDAEIRRYERLVRLDEGLLVVRFYIAHILFEKALYKDPTQDLTRLYWNLVTRLEFLRAPEELWPKWATDIYLISDPVDVDHLVGEFVHYQVLEALRDRFHDNLVGNPGVAAFLIRNLYEPGGSIGWQELITRVTGKPLDPSALLRALVQTAPGNVQKTRDPKR